jgi:3-dehydroquinate synthetase
VEMLVLQCDEEHKTMDEVGLICRRALDVGLGRTGVLVALGGGVCSDLVTVAAAIIRRGIGHVRMPTTLVGQVDAGIGIKGATNHFGKKSFLGVFHPPRGVLIDSQVLASLPTRFVRDGIAEIIKIAAVRDAELLEQIHVEGRTLLESGFQSECGDAVIESAITAMLDELEPNIFESHTYRRLVDFGHTFSPALESACGFAISHGQAVAVDIALSSALAVELELLPRDEFELIADVIASVGLPLYTPQLTLDLCREALEHAEEHRGGSANLVVPDGIGSGCFVASAGAVTDQALQHALARVRQLSTRLVPV